MSKNSNVAPCIINKGTIFHKKDMLRALETFENLNYDYIVDGHTVACGSGDLVKVFASKNSATMIINNCVFINVLSFNYLNFRTLDDGHTEIDLMADSRILRLVSTNIESKTSMVVKDSQPSVDQFADEETFALLEESENEEED